MDGFTGSLDDSISAGSTSDVQDRLSSLELRVQQQEDELSVLKAALAEVLRRLEVPTPCRKQPSKGSTPLRESYSMSCIANGSSVSRKANHRESQRDSSSASMARKETFSSAAKSGPERMKNKPPMQVSKGQRKDTPANPRASYSSRHAPSRLPIQSQRHFQESGQSSPAIRFLQCPPLPVSQGLAAGERKGLKCFSGNCTGSQTHRRPQTSSAVHVITPRVQSLISLLT